MKSPCSSYEITYDLLASIALVRRHLFAMDYVLWLFSDDMTLKMHASGPRQKLQVCNKIKY